MASLRKRAREEDISIRVAAGEPLAAESFVLRALCSCAQSLPAGAQQWDVSGLLLDGQPFSRETVSCWLACAVSSIHGLEELQPADVQQLSTAAGLTQVLAFAEAVGSYKGLCNAACSQLQRLRLVLKLPEQQTLELPVVANYYYFDKIDGNRLTQRSLRVTLGMGPQLSAEQQREVQQQVAKQLAALLRSAHVLRLQPLLDVLHQFIAPNIWPGWDRLLCGVAELVFSDAVLEAALGSSTLSREAYISNVLSQPCSLTPGKVGHSSLLKPTEASFEATSDGLVFEAELLRDFIGGRAGDTVKVTLDLFGTTYEDGDGVLLLQLKSDSVGSHAVALPAQLLVGYSLADAAALESLLKGDRG